MAKSVIPFRTRHGERFRHQMNFILPSRTKQSFRDEVNINTIMRRALRGEAVPQSRSPGEFLDVANATTYHDAINRIQEADQIFSALPADIRRRFNGDPAALLNEIEQAADAGPDSELYQDLVGLGILRPPVSGGDQPPDPGDPAPADPETEPAE